MFEEFEEEYIKFDRIDNPPSKRPDICAFLLIDKLLPGNGDIISASEHDEIYLDVDCEKFEKLVTKEDIIYLSRCGVHYDEDTDSLSMFT
jgi:hypothetical protein